MLHLVFERTPNKKTTRTSKCPVALMNYNLKELFEQGQNSLRLLIRLSQHGCCGLRHNLRLGQIGCLSSIIGIQNSATRCRQIVRTNLQIRYRKLQSVLIGTQLSTGLIDRRNCRIKSIQRIL